MKTLSIFFFLVLTAFFINGCAVSKDNGFLTHSEEITEAFEKATVIPGHTYYYTGPQALPDAIIGITDSYTLQENDKKFWVKVDISEKMLQDWNIIIDNDRRGRSAYYGYAIMAPDGRQAGIWYSKYRYTVVKFPDAETIVIYTPNSSMKNQSRLGSFGTQY